ncbi:hypothetical protein A3K29_05970 [Candidatus Collierbacteria bacterium RIFOXYB2_FULL_46_14]|uniref:HMA domain-containing protein n=1 Tax=Candidatus Collierbacteria bacterium GW2011_GWA2_46_26 TaxID=1618381 RepID=A0A0G1PHU0_9BACT|nr:MAG: hypothetical protein UX47_C0013G0013 [Candidatus Collierbacteria bacterium GW2011_GWA2_46_26]OGD73636.1 MAG: hypothetical protein A3K29_05970 [Candidatus Collierbacteria bacterium RIFOXYB2_FULL_46_14]OGD76678.1 MAG: hypothetical protein A3K43_05970 [Candidatus Collierbacteria bacterium RIFOXYA2_FULL_46_20]OGD78014.1 MAG: hypothetical protein A3K39_05970 [Candidatus Collierbacteria bacterium RIFOXYC2_FULL_43_15]OGD80038.1 MAG: hypothetical protein A2320_00400 [Pseudomonadales bacterium G
MLSNKEDRTVSTFYIRGLHCASCELIIEKRLKKTEGVIMADVSLDKETLSIETEKDHLISVDFLNGFFAGDGYAFSTEPFQKQSKTKNISCEVRDEGNPNDRFVPFMVAALFLMGFYILQKTGFASLVSVNSQSALPVFFLFGLLAGVSSCAALVGSLVLSMSKQWMSKYSENDSLATKSEPHILFNIGRVAGYGFFGAILGFVGNFFRLSPSFSAMLVIAVSVVMIVLGLQMLGVKAVQKFQFRLPKSITRSVSDENNFQGKLSPLFMGALTFFLPCGFTVTAQALALASGSPVQGALIMGLFALGTVPGLLAIGLGSTKMLADKNSSKNFSTLAGILVLAFSLFNVNSQLSVLGLTNVGDVIAGIGTRQILGRTTTAGVINLVPMVGGKQVIKMEASARGYSPNRFQIRVGVPTIMEVTDTGTSGCTNAIISKLFEGQIDLIPGQVSTREFTPAKVGVYKFTCWMGMVSGTIEVVDSQGSVGTVTEPVGSGAKGCGCGGSGTGSCGGNK